MVFSPSCLAVSKSTPPGLDAKSTSRQLELSRESICRGRTTAGTVLTTDQVDRAVAAGAKFIVSPGLNPKVVRYCVEKGVPVTPGTANPSDIEQAIERSGTKAGNRGADAAHTAIEMANLVKTIPQKA